MAGTCTVCRHEKAAELNQMIANGVPNRTVAVHAGTTSTSIQRHRQHLPSQVKTAVSRSKNAELRKTGVIWSSRLNNEYLTACERGNREANQDNPMWMTPRLKAVELGLRITGQMGSNNGSTIQVNVGCLVMPLDQTGEEQEDDAIDVECEDAGEAGE